jgi:hypothetical protein
MPESGKITAREIAIILFLCISCLLFSGVQADAESFFLKPSSGLNEKLKNVAPGDSIHLAAGIYSRGITLTDIDATPDDPVVIQAQDPDNPPVFTGAAEGVKLRSCSFIKLKNLVFQGFTSNGINIDDSGQNGPSHHILLENIQVLNTGGKGNQDAIKLSGVTDFVLRNCDIEGWGGSAIDLVGCRNGIIEQCTISGKEGFRSGNGIQIKGGSRNILVQHNLFRHAGMRTVQIGGLTGKQYFRPSVGDFEAKDITVAGNIFIGGEAQIAWVTAQDSHVHHNLFYQPEKWLGRILQETRDQQFKPCQRGVFERNVVVTDQRVSVFFNVGKGTDPESFVFRENLWFRPDGSNRPNLPTFEKDGVYDIDPMVLATSEGGLEINSAAQEFNRIGPDAYQPFQVQMDFADISVPGVTIPEIEYSSLDWIRDLLR